MKSNKYKCAYCKQIYIRKSDKQWIKSICSTFGHRTTRLILIKNQTK